MNLAMSTVPHPVVVLHVSLVGAPAQPAAALAHQLKTALQLQQTPRVVRHCGELVAMVLDAGDADALQRPECVVVAATLFGVSVGLRVQQQPALTAQQGPPRAPPTLASTAADVAAARGTGAAKPDCDWSSEDDGWIPDAWRHIDCEEHARKANGGQPITLRS